MLEQTPIWERRVYEFGDKLIGRRSLIPSPGLIARIVMSRRAAAHGIPVLPGLLPWSPLQTPWIPRN